MKESFSADYTKDQYALMAQLEDGIIFESLSADKQEIFRYLSDCQIVQPREDIAIGFCLLSEKGKRILTEHRRALSAEKQQVQQSATEKAEQKADKRRDRAFQILLALLGFVLGLIADNLVAIITVVYRWFVNS